MSDEEFVALMDAEYKNSYKVDNEINKKIVWNRLKAQIGRKKHLSTKIIPRVAMIGLAFLLVGPLLLSYNNDNTIFSPKKQIFERSKGKGSEVEAAFTKLSAYKIGSNGELHRSTGNHFVGDALVFKVNIVRPMAIALTRIKNNTLFDVRFLTVMSQSGVGFFLRKNKNDIYGYRIVPGDKYLKFCVVADENSTLLNKKLIALNKKSNSLPSESCIQVNVISDN